jgi:hypothetical protein
MTDLDVFGIQEGWIGLINSLYGAIAAASGVPGSTDIETQLYDVETAAENAFCRADRAGYLAWVLRLHAAGQDVDPCDAWFDACDCAAPSGEWEDWPVCDVCRWPLDKDEQPATEGGQ